MSAIAAPAPTNRETVIGYLCGVGLLFIWTSFIVLSRLGVSGGFSPLDMTALRLAFGLIAMAPFALRFGLFGLPLIQVAALSFFGGVGMALFAFHGLKFAPAAHGGVLMPGLLPLWAALLAWGLLGQKPVARQWLGLGLTIAGAMVVGAESFQHGDGGSWRGDLLFPCASFCWGVFGTLVRRWKIAVLPAANAVCVGAALAYLPIWGLTTDGALFQTPWTTLLMWGLFQGVLALVISMLLYNRAVMALGPVRPALITSLVPGCAALSAVPILGETVSMIQMAGLLLTMIGMIIALSTPPSRTPSSGT